MYKNYTYKKHKYAIKLCVLSKIRYEHKLFNDRIFRGNYIYTSLTIAGDHLIT